MNRVTENVLVNSFKPTAADEAGAAKMARPQGEAGGVTRLCTNLI